MRNEFYNQDPTNHDCHTSPEDGCEACDSLEARITQELPRRATKPIISHADYPPNMWSYSEQFKWSK